MAEIRETHVERDADGRVIDTKVIVDRPKKKGGFAPGLILGAILVAGGIGAYAYSQGSFENAGSQADRATVVAEEQVGSTIETTGDALETAGDNAEQATDTAANETSDTATN